LFLRDVRVLQLVNQIERAGIVAFSYLVQNIGIVQQQGSIIYKVFNFIRVFVRDVPRLRINLHGEQKRRRSYNCQYCV
jgi:hypothetical protein